MAESPWASVVRVLSCRRHLRFHGRTGSLAGPDGAFRADGGRWRSDRLEGAWRLHEGARPGAGGIGRGRHRAGPGLPRHRATLRGGAQRASARDGVHRVEPRGHSLRFRPERARTIPVSLPGRRPGRLRLRCRANGRVPGLERRCTDDGVPVPRGPLSLLPVPGRRHRSLSGPRRDQTGGDFGAGAEPQRYREPELAEPPHSRAVRAGCRGGCRAGYGGGYGGATQDVPVVHSA